jgi:hypothetical protein
MEHLTSDERDLLAKARAATPGSWEWRRPTGSTEGGFIQHNRDLDFIASANPATVVKLLEEIERLRNILSKTEVCT